MEKKDDFHENYNITFSINNQVIGSLYVVTDYTQSSSGGFQTLLNNISGTISCKGIFSDFNNGTAIIEYNNETGKRCLTVYKKSSIESSPSKKKPLPKLTGDWLYEVSILRRTNNKEKPNFNLRIFFSGSIVKDGYKNFNWYENDKFPNRIKIIENVIKEFKNEIFFINNKNDFKKSFHSKKKGGVVRF